MVGVTTTSSTPQRIRPLPSAGAQDGALCAPDGDPPGSSGRVPNGPGLSGPIPSGPVPSGPVPVDCPPFRRADCPGEADRLLGLGLVRQVVADVLVAFDAPESREVRAGAVALLVPALAAAGGDWVVGFASAAWLHTGRGAQARPPEEVHVIVPPGRRRPNAAGLRGRQLRLPPEQVMYVGAVAVTVPVRTAADVARDLPAAQAVPVLRRLGELTDVRPHHVLQLLTTMRYARGAATARQVVRTWAETS